MNIYELQLIKTEAKRNYDWARLDCKNIVYSGGTLLYQENKIEENSNRIYATLVTITIWPGRNELFNSSKRKRGYLDVSGYV